MTLSLVAASPLIFFPAGPDLKEQVGNGVHLSFVLFFLSGAGALLDSSGIRMFAPFVGVLKKNGPAQALVLGATVMFFLPDHAGAALLLNDLGMLKGGTAAVIGSAIAGSALAGGLSLAAARYARADFIGSFFETPQMLLFFSMVKILGSGGQGFSEFTLVPSLQRGLMKFSHDMIHQTFVFLMVPDHPLLKTTVWNFIGFFFGSNIARYEALLLLLALPLIFIGYSLTRPIAAGDTVSGAQRRMFAHHILSDRRRKALPVIVFVLLIIAVWFSQGGESVSQLYVPKPKPVVEDKGVVMIPVNDPTMDLRDGALHKFVLVHEGREIRMLVIRKPDAGLSLCLDACEICPPEGYGQRDDHVVCIYCNTPIPVATLGEPGGCNPIPLSSRADERFIRVDVAEILKKWEYVNSGKSKEGIR
ncbi:MAG: hypothetical protein OHK006_06130 [Thermodesulfovibrionales bacterium]